MRRVVITGIGSVTPLGSGAENSWKCLLEGRCGIDKIKSFDVSDLPVKIGAEVPIGDENNGMFNFNCWVSEKDRRKNDNFIIFGIAAASQAINDAGWRPENEEELSRTGVMVGSGIGGLPGIYDASIALYEKGARRVSPFFIPSTLINLVSGQISIRFGFTGPNHAVATACSTGAHAIGDATRLIQFDDADVMVAGGAEAAICPLGIAGFASARALASKFNDNPKASSRPWDKDRDGFVMGEGAGVVVLEEFEHAKKRGAKIYAEIVGYGLSSDANHVTAPASDGSGATRAMKMALQRAKINHEDVDYINAHGTSTPLGDEIELAAVKRLFGASAYSLSMSSTKSAIGHLLGAAGAVETVFSVLAIRDNIVPPTLNLDHPSDGCDIDLVPHIMKERFVKVAMSNSFGFGGTNATLIFREIR